MSDKATTILSGAGRKSLGPGPVAARKRLIVAAIAACFVSVPAWSNPTAPQVVNGSASFNQVGKLFTVSNSSGAIINWNTFSIGTNETTRFNQASASSSVLNRVLANDPSVLLGTLSSNGRVWLVNPAGIMVGQGARIDLAGFIASTLNVRNEDFLAGRLNFGATPNAGKIENYGQISTPSGGSVFLVAPNIENHGIINAPNGEVILAAGQTVQLIDTGTPGVKVDITGAEGNATNLGQIVAEAGRIGMAGVLAKNSGTLNASSLIKEGGRIFLKANKDVTLDAASQIKADAGYAGNGGNIFVWADDTVRVDGSISARGGSQSGDGGFIETSGAHVKIADAARVSTLATHGKTGTWLIDPNDFTIAVGGDMSGAAVASALGGGNFTIETATMGTAGGNGDINVNDAVSWSANVLTLTAERDININAVMTASGTSSLAMTTGTAVFGGTVKVGLDTSGFIGRVDFPGRSGTGFLSIQGAGYTVINNLGVAGDLSASTLQGMSGGLFVSNAYALGSNIDATPTSGWNPNGSGGYYGFATVGDYSTASSASQFKGRFDGLGHTITGLTINRPATDYVGLFGFTNGALIRNVGLVGGSVSGNDFVGGFAGKTLSGGSDIITNAYNTGSVAGFGTGNGSIGGLVGYSYGAINNSYNTGNVSGVIIVGGLAGENRGAISNSYNTGGVSGSGGTTFVGGVAGENGGGTIINSYSTGNVSGNDTVGGLVGYNSGMISKSYSAGSVSGSTNLGGLLGYYSSGSISNSYWDKDTSLKSNCAGFGSPAGCTGFITADMKKQASFAGFDFANTWTVDEGVSYPTLRVFGGPSVTNTWTGVADNFWITVGNWSLGHAPTTTETVNIPDVVGTAFVEMGGGAFTAKSVTSAELFKLTGSGTSFTLTSGGSFNAGLNLGAGTSLTSQGALSLSSYTLGAGAKINLTLSGTGILTIGAQPYTVINSLGAAGSATGTDLQGMSGSLAGKYALGSNIDASATSTWNSNGSGGYYGFAPVATFTGVFDGLGHIITGLTINRPSTDYVGLFGSTSGATIRNVGLEGGSVSGGNYVGGLVGYNGSGTVDNSYASGSVTGNNSVGGLVGYNNFGTISSSYAAGSVTGVSDVGGLAGYNGGTLTNSHYDIDNVTINGASHVTEGGLYTTQYQAWLPGRTLNIADYGASLPLSAGYYTIGSTQGLKDMLAVADNPDYKFRLTANLDLATLPDWHIPVFAGSEFDGGGKTLANLSVNQPFNSKIGFIGRLSGSGTVTGLGLINVSITGKDYVGGLVGYDDYGTVSNSYATGSVTGNNYVGGLVGYNNNGDISNSHATVSATGYSNNVGGLVGYNAGSISNSYATGYVDGSFDGGINNVGGLVGHNTGSIDNAYATGNVSGGDNVGGLVGYNDYASVSNSYATGNVTGNYYVGGLVGYNVSDCSCSSITNSYASGNVTGSDSVGGLVGYYDYGIVSNSYATGLVTGTSNVGGLVGYNSSGTVNNSFWDTETSGQTYSAGGIGMATADMMQSVNFTSATAANSLDSPSWSTPPWGFIDGVAYPYLQWRFPTAPQIVSGTLIGDTGGAAIQTAQNGNLLTKSSTGANGFYYQALDPGSVGNGSALLAYFVNSGGSPAAAVRLGDGGDLTGVDLLTNKLVVSSSGAAAVSNGILAAAKGSLSSSDIPYSVSANNLALEPGIEFQTALGTGYALDGNVTTTGGASQRWNGPVTLLTNATLSAGGGITLTNPANQISGRIDMTAGGPVSLVTSGNLNLGTINAGVNPVVLSAAGAVANALGTSGTNVVAGSLAMGAANGVGTSAIPFTTQVNNLNVVNTTSGGIVIKNTGVQPASVMLADNAATGAVVSFLNTGDITSTSGFTLMALHGGDLALLSNGNITWNGGNLATPSGSVLISADGSIAVTGALTSPVDLALSSVIAINVNGSGSVYTAGTGTASFTAPSVAINGAVNAADDVGVIANTINLGAGSSTSAGHDVIFAAANVRATNASVTARHDISAAVTGDLHLNGSGFTAGNDIFINLMGATSTLYLNDVTGLPQSYLWAKAPSTVHLDFPGRTADGMVVNGIAENPLTFVAASSGASGLFYGAAMTPAPFGTGLEVTYGLGTTAAAPTVLDAVMAAISASTAPPSDTFDANGQPKKRADRLAGAKLATCDRPGE